MERARPKTPTLETPRLLLLPLTLEDAEQAQPLFAHWEIVRHLASQVPWPFPPDGCHTFYRDTALPAMARGDQWHWSIRTKANPQQMIGSIALVAQPQTPGHRNNRGFWIGQPYQRHGYATEAAVAATDFWFDVLGFPDLTVPKAHANEPSRRISQTTGMTLLRTQIQQFVCGPLPTDIWHLTADQWHQHRPRP
ncbi:Protein N-acetyltransferase, RimJ/RimL family [Granulicella pectinivorans]|uniref:Protein N-acetyltransferase, RimJ/RimL family n=1 Tax=Granulicella pectinivorans TaxID=474950 RepID=A0A1I6M195_9BACT|nr:GNAT family N-acetyltransferase [Granulicella pectinivorans]SFS09487.1 Protein N-acetyltransferase, RimJ/RimL family [Granulicella pectinivorans]